jgi:archaellin
LPSSIEASGWRTDDDHLNITVRVEAGSHSVSIQRNQVSTRPEEEVRFLRLWAVLHESLAGSGL